MGQEYCSRSTQVQHQRSRLPLRSRNDQSRWHIHVQPKRRFEGLASGEVGSDSFVYQIADGQGGFDTARVSIAIQGVNDAPFAVLGLGDQSSFDGSGAFSVPTSGAFDDADGETLSFALGAGVPTWLQINPTTGVVTTVGTIPADASDKSNIVGSPNGLYDVEVIATDSQGATASDTFRLSVTNLLPVAVSDTGAVGEDGSSIAGNVITDALTGDTDTAPDSDPLTVTAAEQAGTSITIGAPFTVSGGGVLTLAADGAYSFDPGLSYNGLDAGEQHVEVITYTVDDGNGGAATATLTLTITGANDSPVIIDPAQVHIDPANPVAADPATVIPVQEARDGADFTSTPLIDVSAYAADPDGDPLTFTTGSDLPAGLTLNSDGTVTGVIDRNASQGGDDPAAAPGRYTITVDVSDGTSTTPVTMILAVLQPVTCSGIGHGGRWRRRLFDCWQRDHGCPDGRYGHGPGQRPAHCHGGRTGWHVDHDRGPVHGLRAVVY